MQTPSQKFEAAYRKTERMIAALVTTGDVDGARKSRNRLWDLCNAMLGEPENESRFARISALGPLLEAAIEAHRLAVRAERDAEIARLTIESREVNRRANAWRR